MDASASEDAEPTQLSPATIIAMPNRSSTQALLTLWALAVCACSGSWNRPAEPSSASSAATASSAAPPDDPKSVPGPEVAAQPSAQAPAPAAPSATEKPSRQPRDILEAKDTIFFLSYNDSDLKKHADAHCSKKDPKKSAACMEKARVEIDAEGHQFMQDPKGHWWWLVLRRKGNTLLTVHKMLYEYGAQTDRSVVIRPEGKDHGAKPWRKPPLEVKIEVPNDFRIVVHDPKHGKMVYEAKVGLSGR
jgi:hypothetical protein